MTIGRDFADVLQKATFFELACDLILRAGTQLQPLTPEAAAEVRRSSGRGV